MFEKKKLKQKAKIQIEAYKTLCFQIFMVP